MANSVIKNFYQRIGGLIIGDVQLADTEGVANEINNTWLELGNNISSTQDGNSRGVIKINGSS